MSPDPCRIQPTKHLPCQRLGADLALDTAFAPFSLHCAARRQVALRNPIAAVLGPEGVRPLTSRGGAVWIESDTWSLI